MMDKKYMDKGYMDREAKILERQHTRPLGIWQFLLRLVEGQCKEFSPEDKINLSIITAYNYGVMQGKRMERARRRHKME